MPDGKLPDLGDAKNQDFKEYINYKNGMCWGTFRLSYFKNIYLPH